MSKKTGSKATNWTAYYASTPFTARLTRKYTSSALIGALKRFSPDPASIVEFGGANSCFLANILKELNPREYHIGDTNEYGIGLLRDRLTPEQNVKLYNMSALEYSASHAADVVFSVGLIEHFDPAGTEAMIKAHFKVLRPG